MQTLSFTDVRAHLGELLRQLQAQQEPICISRHGEPSAVLMSVAQYRRLSTPAPGPASALEAWRAQHVCGDDLLEDHDDPWAGVRGCP